MTGTNTSAGLPALKLLSVQAVDIAVDICERKEQNETWDNAK
jgi:hypothetical protein